MQQENLLSFHGVTYRVTLTVQGGNHLTVEVEEEESEAAAAGVAAPVGGGLGAVGGTAVDGGDDRRWVGEFTSQYIEEVAKTTGNFKRFPVFVEMLSAALAGEGESVFVDLLTYADLEMFKARKRGQRHPQQQPTQQQLPHVSEELAKRRYLILTYAVEFDRVHYPLPLVFQETPSVSTLKRTIRRLRSELAQKREEISASAPPPGQTAAQAAASASGAANLSHRLRSKIVSLQEEMQLVHARSRREVAEWKARYEAEHQRVRRLRALLDNRRPENRPGGAGNAKSGVSGGGFSGGGRTVRGGVGAASASGGRAGARGRTRTPASGRRRRTYKRFDPTAYQRERDERRQRSNSSRSARRRYASPDGYSSAHSQQSGYSSAGSQASRDSMRSYRSDRSRRSNRSIRSHRSDRSHRSNRSIGSQASSQASYGSRRSASSSRRGRPPVRSTALHLRSTAASRAHSHSPSPDTSRQSSASASRRRRQTTSRSPGRGRGRSRDRSRESDDDRDHKGGDVGRQAPAHARQHHHHLRQQQQQQQPQPQPPHPQPSMNAGAAQPPLAPSTNMSASRTGNEKGPRAEEDANGVEAPFDHNTEIQLLDNRLNELQLFLREAGATGATGSTAVPGPS